MESQVRLHPNGYVEMVLVGVPTSEELRALIDQAKVIAAQHKEQINLLIDAREGRAGRDARSFSYMLQTGRVPNLNQLYILIDESSTNPDAAKRSGIIISSLTSALGLRPIYVTDEADARAKAAAID